MAEKVLIGSLRGPEGPPGTTDFGELEDVPDTFPPSPHDHDELYYTKAEIDAELGDLDPTVDWADIVDKPTTFAPTAHDHDDRYYTETEIEAIVAGIETELDEKSDVGHTHDDRYFTEAETSTEITNAVSAEVTARNIAITAAIAGLINSAPGLLDTLDEIAAALGDDPNFAATMTTALNGKQAQHAILDSLAGLASAANKLPYFSGANTVTMADFTSFARTLLDDGDAATARTTLGLGTSATLDTPASGDASGTQVVKGNDSRLTDARTPTAHTHPSTAISDSTTVGRSLIVAANAAAVRTAAGLGTAAVLDAPASGNAASGEVVKGSDTRLADSRTPTTHTHTASQISDASTIGKTVLTAADAAAIRTALAITAVKDVQFAPITGQTTIDEFNDDSLDVGWTLVEPTGAPAGSAGSTRTITEAGDALSIHLNGGDTAGYIRGLVKPLSGLGGAFATGDAFITRHSQYPQQNSQVSGFVLSTAGTVAGVQLMCAIYNASSVLHAGLQTFTAWASGANLQDNTYANNLPAIWARIVYLGTNSWRVDTSFDGISWIKGTAATWANTPTHVGPACSSWGSNKSVATWDTVRRVAGVS